MNDPDSHDASTDTTAANTADPKGIERERSADNPVSASAADTASAALVFVSCTTTCIATVSAAASNAASSAAAALSVASAAATAALLRSSKAKAAFA